MIRGLSEYTDFIDGLVPLNQSVQEGWVKRGHWPQTPDYAGINEVLGRLSLADREVIASLIRSAKMDGIHDTLAHLQERVDLHGMRISVDGVELANMPFGSPMNYDFVCRANGDEWPEE
jgi:hypothetical protein